MGARAGLVFYDTSLSFHKEVSKKGNQRASPLETCAAVPRSVRAFGWKPSVSKAALKGVVGREFVRLRGIYRTPQTGEVAR